MYSRGVSRSCLRSFICCCLIHASFEIAKTRMVSRRIRLGAEMRTRPVGGWTLRWTFLMSFRTTSTAMSPRWICETSVLTLRLDDQEDPLDLVHIVLQQWQKCRLDRVLLGLVPAKVVRLDLLHCRVDRESQIQHRVAGDR